MPNDNGPPQTRFAILNDQNKLLLLAQSRANVNHVLKQVLQDESATLQLSYRTARDRLYVQTAAGVVPSLDHLSSGQANLFNLFATIIRYADRSNPYKSIRLHEIEGIVLIDEIEAQAHTDLQFEVLPKLLQLFPKVQFILTSHSPLFLLGMENVFGPDGFEIIDMPGGRTITTERFSEFRRSWELYRQTEAYERDLRSALHSGTKPLVLTEGETDPKYIRTALELLNRQDLIDALDIEWVGTQGPQGPLNTGQKGLDHTRNVLEANPGLTGRKVLLLYDCDTNKPPVDTDLLSVRVIPRNDENSKTQKGIENLLPSHLFVDRFYRSREVPQEYGAINTIQEFLKMDFCRYVCDERRDVGD